MCQIHFLPGTRKNYRRRWFGDGLTRSFWRWFTYGCEPLQASAMDQQRSTLRFPFVAAAEIALESSPSISINASVKELSLHGCYVDTPAPFSPKTRALVEAKATVIYAHPTLGMGLAFRDVKPDCRIVMQKWLLAALPDKEPKP
jgi:hypothetical protein